MSHEIGIAPGGEIAVPNFHDAKLMGISLLPESALSMLIKTTDGKMLRLLCEGMERLCAVNFREGNTILDITVSSGDEIDAADVARAYGVDEMGSDFLPKVVLRLIKEKRFVVKVNPSYGCALTCICANILIGSES